MTLFTLSKPNGQCQRTLRANILLHVITRSRVVTPDDHCHHGVIEVQTHGDSEAELTVVFHHCP